MRPFIDLRQFLQRRRSRKICAKRAPYFAELARRQIDLALEINKRNPISPIDATTKLQRTQQVEIAALAKNLELLGGRIDSGPAGHTDPAEWRALLDAVVGAIVLADKLIATIYEYKDGVMTLGAD